MMALHNLKNKIVIYGAGMVGVSIYYALREIAPDCTIDNFIVSDKEGNPSEIDGIKVICLNEYSDRDVQVFIATPENYHAAIVKALQMNGFHQYICIDSDLEAQIMKYYYDRRHLFPSLSDLERGAEKPEVAIYIARFHKDQKLSSPKELPVWMSPIQAGAALTDIKIAEIRDDAGENISRKNVNYSELSAMYWLNKHIDKEYIGLFHYRRMLDISREDLFKLKNNQVDVILPYPTIYDPDIGEHHKRYIKDSDWEAMQRALEELAPEYAKAAPSIFAGRYFYNYNMLLARKEVFRQYCDWMFPILERTEELSVPKGSDRADRYIGYLGENLTTLFFIYHKNDFKIFHAGRKMLL